MGTFRDFFIDIFVTKPSEWWEVIIEKISNVNHAFIEASILRQIELMDYVDELENYYNGLVTEYKDDPDIKSAYENKLNRLKAEGKRSQSDIVLGWLGKQVASAVFHIRDQALPRIMEWIDTFAEAYNMRTEELNAMKKLAQSGEFGLNAVVSFMLGVTLYPAVMSAGAPIWRKAEQTAEVAVRSRLLTPTDLIMLMWRFPDKHDYCIEELKKHGFSDNDITNLEDVSKFYPSPSDLVTWQAREVFEPEMIKKYGLDDEYEGIDKQPFYKAGMSEEQIKNYWRAHWVHASFTQVMEMLYRDILTEDDVYMWYRLVEIPPYWRTNLTEIMYPTLTRVDTRRAYELGVIDEDHLQEELKALGYRGWRLDAMVSFYHTFKIQEYRKLTAERIIKGMKKGILSEEQTVERLMDLGYTENDAIFIVLTELAEGSPETPLEYQKITESYKKAISLPYKEITQEMIDLDKEISKLKKEKEKAIQEKAPEAYVREIERKLTVKKTEFKLLYEKPEKKSTT